MSDAPLLYPTDVMSSSPVRSPGLYWGRKTVGVTESEVSDSQQLSAAEEKSSEGGEREDEDKEIFLHVGVFFFFFSSPTWFLSPPVQTLNFRLCFMCVLQGG